MEEFGEVMREAMGKQWDSSGEAIGKRWGSDGEAVGKQL